MKKLMKFFKEEEGATAPEYGLMVALIAGVIILTVTALGGAVSSSFTAVTTAINAAV